VHQPARGVPVLGAHKGYTRTHQAIADVREFGGGLEVAHRLAEANLITNKNLRPNDQPNDWDRPSGLRIGTTEVTRLGMGELEMQAIADMIAGVLVEGRDPEHVRQEVVELRAGHQRIHYCFTE
jgi:glycine hydroxymethyltransferase